MKKRILALLLAGLMLSTVACNTTDPKETNPNPSGTQQSGETDPSDTETTRPNSGLPEKTFNGATYRVSSFPAACNEDIYDEEGFGEDKLSNEAHERALYVMQTYDMKFDTTNVSSDYEAHYKYVSDMVKTNDDVAELVYGHVVQTCNNAALGHYYDLYSVPYIDTTNPWWPTQTVEELTVYGKMYVTSTAMTRELLQYSSFIYINKDLFEEYNKELPYDWVRKGTWTLDKLISETQDVWTDKNGDGLKSIEDVFGFASSPDQPGIVAACNANVLSRSEDGGYEITLVSEHMSAFLEKLKHFYYETDGAWRTTHYGSTAAPNFSRTFFRDGHSLYQTGQMWYYSVFQNTEDLRYGVIPLPKYDEIQADYYVFTEPNLLSIPVTCKNTEFAGYIFELMTYLGYYDFYPVLLDSTLKGGVAESPDDAEMLQLIQDHLTVKFSYCYDGWEGFGFLLGSLDWGQDSGKTNITFLNGIGRKKAQGRLDKVMAAFRGEFSE